MSKIAMDNSTRLHNSEEKSEHADLNLWNIGIYIRLSREDGKAESESVSNQKKILRDYLEHTFDGICGISEYYIDDGQTGTDDTRDSFSRLVQDIESGIINCVLCKTLSRAFRNYADQGYYLEDFFPRRGVRFISLGDPAVDTYRNPEILTGLELPISGLLNDRFAAQTSMAIRRTFEMKRRNGDFIGAFAPYGYRKDPLNKNHLMIDEYAYLIKRQVLGWILDDGMSLRACARQLNTLGIPNPTAYKREMGYRYHNPKVQDKSSLWSGTTVKHMLLEPVNLGHMVQGKQRVVSYKIHEKVNVPQQNWTIIKNTHEATFSQEEYNQLQKALTPSHTSGAHDMHVSLLAGLLRCADCQRALQKKTAKGYRYYSCRTYVEQDRDKCTKHSIRADILEDLIMEIVRVHFDLCGLSRRLDKILTARVDAINRRKVEFDLRLLAEKTKERDHVRFLLDGLYADWKSGEIREDDYKRLRDTWRRVEEQLSEQIETIDIASKRYGIRPISESEAEIDRSDENHNNVNHNDIYHSNAYSINANRSNADQDDANRSSADHDDVNSNNINRNNINHNDANSSAVKQNNANRVSPLNRSLLLHLIDKIYLHEDRCVTVSFLFMKYLPVKSLDEHK